MQGPTCTCQDQLCKDLHAKTSYARTYIHAQTSYARTYMPRPAMQGPTCQDQLCKDLHAKEACFVGPNLNQKNQLFFQQCICTESMSSNSKDNPNTVYYMYVSDKF